MLKWNIDTFCNVQIKRNCSKTKQCNVDGRFFTDNDQLESNNETEHCTTILKLAKNIVYTFALKISNFVNRLEKKQSSNEFRRNIIILAVRTTSKRAVEVSGTSRNISFYLPLV